MSTSFFFWTSHWECWWIKNYKWVCFISEVHQMLMHYRKLFHKVIWASVFWEIFSTITNFILPELFLFFLLSWFHSKERMWKHPKICKKLFLNIWIWLCTGVSSLLTLFMFLISYIFPQISTSICLFFVFLLIQHVFTEYLEDVKNCSKM